MIKEELMLKKVIVFAILISSITSTAFGGEEDIPRPRINSTNYTLDNMLYK